jgi:hypothetical protein
VDAASTDQIARLRNERDRLREALRVAKLWLEHFCDEQSDVWRHPDLTPRDVACEALREVEDAESETGVGPGPAGTTGR